MGTPFTAKAGSFRVDESSYGITYLKACRGESFEELMALYTAPPAAKKNLRGGLPEGYASA
jgi:hypothetical protein